MAGERIMEAIDMGIDDLNLLRAHAEAQARRPGVSIAPPQRNPVYVVLGNINAETHLAKVISKIKASNLQDALLVLPFEKVEKLMRFIDIWAEKVCFFFITILTFLHLVLPYASFYLRWKGGCIWVREYMECIPNSGVGCLAYPIYHCQLELCTNPIWD